MAKRSKRLGFLFALILLGAGAIAGADLERDLSPARAPGTVIYVAAMAGCLAAVLTARTVTVTRTPRTVVMTRLLAGVAIRREVHPVGAEAVVRLTPSRRPAFLLEIQDGGTRLHLDGSSWKTELEPLGRALARELDIGYEG